VNVNGEQIGVVLSVGLIVLSIFLLLRFSMWGIRLRAVVVNRNLAELRGVNERQVSRLAWSGSYILAAITGVLIAPLIGGDPSTLTLIVVNSLAAAVVGGLLSLPLALASGIGLGVLDGLILGYVPPGSLTSWTSGVLPFLLLFLALIVQARRLSAGHFGETKMAAVADLGPAAFRRRPAVARMVVTVLALLLAGFILRSAYPTYVSVLCNGAAIAIIYLSFRVFTASTGLVSFAQAAFAGIGAFTAANLVSSAGWPWLAGIMAGGVAAAASSIVVALTTVRLRGVFLALATLAFAQLVNQGLFTQASFTGSLSGKLLPRPGLLRTDLSYLVLLGIAFALIGYVCERFQYSAIGRELKADLGSATGAQSIGIRPQRGRALAFMFSAGVAGVGGALLAGNIGLVSVDSWATIPTVFLWLAAVGIAGIGSTTLMLQIGVLSAVIPRVVALNFPSIQTGYVALFGLVALLVLRVPGGTYSIEQRIQERALRGLSRLRVAREKGLSSGRTAQSGGEGRVSA
jgi:branched-subunit amino acid ABC-type transport system permease component